jgi:hypothetical protein
MAWFGAFDDRLGPSGWVRQADWGSRTSRPAHKVQAVNPVGGLGGPRPSGQSSPAPDRSSCLNAAMRPAPAGWLALVRTDYAAELRHLHTSAARMQVSPHRRRAPPNSPDPVARCRRQGRAGRRQCPAPACRAEGKPCRPRPNTSATTVAGASSRAGSDRRAGAIRPRPCPWTVDGLRLGTVLHRGGLPRWLPEAVQQQRWENPEGENPSRDQPRIHERARVGKL